MRGRLFTWGLDTNGSLGQNSMRLFTPQIVKGLPSKVKTALAAKDATLYIDENSTFC